MGRAGDSLPWNIKPLANFRFGSVFRNAIPPKRDYTPPSFEDIFEQTTRRGDERSTWRGDIGQERSTWRGEIGQERSTWSPPRDLLQQGHLLDTYPETDRKSESTTASYFRSQLQQIHQQNQQMLFGEKPKISTTQRTTERPKPKKLTREEQYLKAQQKLMQMQREQASTAKAHQSQSKLMMMVLAKQKELEEKKRQKEDMLKRRDEEEQKVKDRVAEEGARAVDQNQYQTRFQLDRNYEEKKRVWQEEQRRREEERKKREEDKRKRVDDKRKAIEEEKRRVSEEEERRRLQKEAENLALRRQEQEREQEQEKRREQKREMEREKEQERQQEIRKEAEEKAYRDKLNRWRNKYQKLSLPTGQQFIDKSTETKILGTRRIQEQEQEQVVEQEPETTTAMSIWPGKEQEQENELDNLVLGQQKQKKNSGNPFSQELCEKLLVPCRFVTEHPCCSLPQQISLVARPRAMDGSADLRWRFMQSRGRHAGGRMIGGFKASRGEVEQRPGTSSFSVKSKTSIPYSHWTSKEVVAVPRYNYNGGPSVTSSILRHCWRLTYLNCAKEREHPCCRVNSRSQGASTSVLASNMLDRWLSRS